MESNRPTKMLAACLTLLCTLSACAKGNEESRQSLPPQSEVSTALTSTPGTAAPSANGTTLVEPKVAWENRHWEDLSLRVRQELDLQDVPWDAP